MRDEPLEHIDALYRLARHLTGSDDRAEDLVQDTYARALGGRASYAEGTNLRAWLCRIMRNLYVDGWRRGKADPVQERFGDVPPEPDSTHESLRGDEELERLRNVVATDIEKALGELSTDARTVIVLDIEGFTETECAEVLGCSVGTVKSRLSRARAALRERLRDYAR